MAEASGTDKGIPKNNDEKSKQEESAQQAQNAILVAASLIATVTYSAGLSPPPTIWKEGMKLDPNCIFHSDSNITVTSIRSSLLRPTISCPALSFYMFMSLNTAGWVFPKNWVEFEVLAKL
ncbi:hypothetical protein L1049_014775 [Liquidambar formosana]|uniref:PGG domain-containing protein n=1 Tax=Liquidambar formosana TaxID=63359 RepID=A0AAP0RWG3_LIQFO